MKKILVLQIIIFGCILRKRFKFTISLFKQFGMIGKPFSPSFFKHMNQTNLLVAIGLLFSQTLLLPYLNSLAGNSQISMTLIIAFWICTILLLGCVAAYICREIYFQFINIYEFFIFPIFTMLTINQLKCQSSDYILIISVILLCLGGAVCILNIIYFYSRKVINKNKNILRISINYRLVRIIRFAIFTFLYVVNPQSKYLLVSISFSILSILNIFYSISKFSFQSIYQQFLTLVFSIASFISSIQGMAYSQSYTNYAFLGELTAIGLILFEPSFMIDFLQNKYGYFMDKNIQMRNQHQMLAVFKIMKQILLKKSKQFDYSTKFKNKIYLSYEKMLHKSKKMFRNIGYYNRYLEEGENKNSSSIGSMFNFAAINSILQEEDVFYNLIHVRLMKSDDFFIWEFYIISLVNYRYRNFNKSISEFYKKRLQEKKRNFLEIITENILYENIMKFIPLKQKQYRQHLSITFYKQFKELTNDINKICKNQAQIVSMMKNSSSVSITKYTKILCLRSQLKQKINSQIQKMTDFSFYIFSNNFLYTILLYKLFFQRQQKVLREKIMNLFVKKLAQVSKQNQVFLEFQKKSIVVCSAIANGEILQSNQKFQKTYEPMSLNKKIHSQKLYIGDILLNSQQKQKHQKLFAKASLFHQSKEEQKEHKYYTCFIYRYVKFNSQKYGQNNDFMKVVDKVRISTRIYFCLRQQFNYICVIERIPQDIEYGYRVLHQEINKLQKKGLNPKILKSETMNQLDKQFQCFIISLKQLQYCQDEIDQIQDLEANCSQQFNFDENQDLEQQKTTKIQKSFNQEKQTIYRPQIIFVLAFILCMLVYVSFVFWYQNYKYNQLEGTNQFINLCQKVIQNTLLTEEIVGLQMILYHYFEQTNKNSLCEQYTNVQNMTKYLQNQLLDYANTKFSQLQRMYIMVNYQQPLLINNLISKSYSWYDAGTLINPIHMDYFKYVAFTKNFIFDYARPFQQPKEDFKANFQNIISEMINQNHFKKTSDFYKSVKNSFFQVSSNLSTQYNLSNFLVSTFAIIIFVSIILILSKLISNQKNHLFLLKSLNKQYFTKRMKQTKFICSQLSKIQNSQYERIEINRNMRIKIYKWNSIEQYTFQQIQHICQLQAKQKISQKNAQIQDKNQSEKIALLSKSEVSKAGTNNLSKITLNISIVKSFLNLKFPLILIFLLFFTILGLHTYDNKILQNKIKNNFQYYNVVDNLNKIQYSMLDILMSEWLLYINQPKYKTPQNYMKNFNDDIHLLNTSNYIQDIRTTFDNDSSFAILYKSYCDNHNLDIEQTANCQNFNEGALTYGLAFLASMIVNDGVKSLLIKDSYPNLFQQEICSKLVIFLNYTLDKFGDQLAQSYQTLNTQSKNSQKNIIISMIFLTISLLISSFFLAFHLYKTCKKTRTQVLSMQSKAVLYEKYQDFRPFLNQIYYRKDE